MPLSAIKRKLGLLVQQPEQNSKAFQYSLNRIGSRITVACYWVVLIKKEQVGFVGPQPNILCLLDV